MIPFILIVMVLYGTSGVDITTQEFQNERACRTAEEVLHAFSKKSLFMDIITECVPK